MGETMIRALLALAVIAPQTTVMIVGGRHRRRGPYVGRRRAAATVTATA